MPEVIRPGLDRERAEGLRQTLKRLHAAEEALLRTPAGGAITDQAQLYAAEEYMRAREAHHAALSGMPERVAEPPTVSPLAQAGYVVVPQPNAAHLQGAPVPPPGTPRLDPLTEEALAAEITRQPHLGAGQTIYCGSEAVALRARRIVGSAHGVLIDDDMDPDAWRVEPAPQTTGHVGAAS